MKLLESKLFDSHGSFLASPLLTTIMLLTFEEYAEIPTKMHSFYSRAFDTLFQKHDADKDQFVRKIKTGLSREDFKTVLSAFCAMSYLEERFSFSDHQIKKTAEASLEYARKVSGDISGVSAESFIKDMTDAVCMLQPDGLDLSFVHRSFQEYFSAAFIEKAHGSRVKQILDRFSLRYTDSVVGMALDLSREKVESEWVVPTIDRYIAEYSRKKGKRNVGAIIASLFERITITRDQDGSILLLFYTNDQGSIGTVETLCRLYPNVLGPGFIIRSVKGLRCDDCAEKVLRDSNKGKARYQLWIKLLSEENEEGKLSDFSVEPSQRDSWWLDALGFNEMFDEMIVKLKTIRDEVMDRGVGRDKIIASIFDLAS